MIGPRGARRRWSGEFVSKVRVVLRVDGIRRR